MFTKKEVFDMKKGFYLSRTGKSDNAIVGRGSMTGNRKERRVELNNYGLHNPKKGPIMIVRPNSRAILFIQRIGNKLIEHYKIL